MQDAIKQWGHKIPSEEVGNIMAAADVDGDGYIDYNEFVAATINVNQLEKEDLIYKAFQEFDEDGSNAISMEELEKARPSPIHLLCSIGSPPTCQSCATKPSYELRVFDIVFGSLRLVVQVPLYSQLPTAAIVSGVELGAHGAGAREVWHCRRCWRPA